MRYFRDVEYGHEIIVVNDGSTDKTADIVRTFSCSFPSLKLINYRKNRGKGYAVKAGMLAARGDYKLFMDADNSVTIDAVEGFFKEMEEGESDVAIGSIALPDAQAKEHAGRHRRLLGSISKLLIRLLAIPGIYDTQRGFKLFSRRAADAIFPLQKIHGFGFDIELLLIARRNGFRIKELPVKWNNPAGSKVNARAYVDSTVELAKIIWFAATGKYDRMTRRIRSTQRSPRFSDARSYTR